MALDTTLSGANSNSYGTLEEYQDYAEGLGWTLTPETAEANLRRATQWLDREHEFRGYRNSLNQVLEWPRYGFRIGAAEAIPTAIKEAQFEMAYLIQQGEDPLATIDLGSTQSTSVKAGPVATTTNYEKTTKQKRYPQIEGLLRDFVVIGGRLVRG